MIDTAVEQQKQDQEMVTAAPGGTEGASAAVVNEQEEIFKMIEKQIIV